MPTQSKPCQISFWARVSLLVGLAVWSWVLIGMDYRTGEIGSSFIHRPILVFHEAGHIIFMPLGEWLTVLGGTLGQVGEPGGHDWIYLFSRTGLLPRAQLIGGLTHKVGALVLLLSLGWAAWLLRRQYPRVTDHVTQED